MLRKLFAVLIGLVAVVFIFWPMLAFADTGAMPPPPTAYDRLIDQITNTLAALLVIVVGFYGRKAILAFERKAKVDVPDPWEAQILAWIDKGIAYAEEQGRKALKRGLVGRALPAKLDTAATFVMDMADDAKLAEKGRVWLEKMIEARLVTQRHSITPPMLLQGELLKSDATAMTPRVSTYNGIRVMKLVPSNVGDTLIVHFEDGTTEEISGMTASAAGLV